METYQRPVHKETDDSKVSSFLQDIFARLKDVTICGYDFLIKNDKHTGELGQQFDGDFFDS
jgi:hypothetical protein